MEYIPDNWVIIRIQHQGETYHKVLAGWTGSYTSGDSWRMNSGITKVVEEPLHWLFHGVSGSVYRCNKDRYGLRHNCGGVYDQLKQRYGDAVTMLDDLDDFSSIELVDTK